jgi:transcriptional regulator with XRE-family HTH domain
MKTPLPTMRDVARRAGVSVSTVSLALRNSPLVSAETQAAVRAAVAELGYRVNPYVAAHMRSRRKPQAGVAAPVLAIVDTQRRRHDWRDNRTSMVRAMLMVTSMAMAVVAVVDVVVLVVMVMAGAVLTVAVTLIMMAAVALATTKPKRRSKARRPTMSRRRRTTSW